MENKVIKLVELGFIEVGSWNLSVKNSERIDFIIKDEFLGEQDLLYSFVCDETVYYVGKTDITLKSRMTNYKAGIKTGSAGSTNKYVHDKVLNLIKNNKNVKIYILLDNSKLNYQGIQISLASGLEINLIKSFNTEKLWNSRGTNSNKNDKNLYLTNDVQIVNKVLINDTETNNFFKLRLGKEYYTKGIISFPKRFENMVPKISGIQVSLIIDNNKPIYATYTFSGQNRKINEIDKLKEWFQNNFNLNDEVNIEIISETEFRVYK